MNQATPDRLQALPVLFDPLKIPLLNLDTQALIAQIDELLPQTQCGLCGHQDGCLPYAHGMVIHGEPANLCIPGGQDLADQLACLLDRPALSATPSKWQTDPRTNRPQTVRAVINESDCIGCTKCIPACPVDAIIGTSKHMHTIITELCTGCEMCLPPCPVDCIELVPYDHHPSPAERTQEQASLRQRYHQHLNRVAQSVFDGTKPVVSFVESAMTNVIITDNAPMDKDTAKNAIELAKIRTQLKKLQKQYDARPSDATYLKIQELTTQLNALSP